MSGERLERLRPEVLDDDQRALREAIVGGPRAVGPQHFRLVDDEGALNGPFGLMLHVPLLGRPLQELGAAIRYRTSLGDRAREVAILEVAAACSSSFEWYAHERVGRAVGLDDDELAALRSGAFSSADPAEEAVAVLTRQLLAGDHPDDGAYASARAALSERGVLEVIVLVGYYRLLSQMMEVSGVGAPTDEKC